MDAWVLLVALVVFLTVVLVAAVLLRPRVQRAMYPDIDVAGWQRTSVTLPWRDRWELYRANATGRATSPRLASLAVQRGRWAEQTTARMLTKGAGPRRLVIGLGIAMTVLGAAALAVSVVAITRDGDWGSLVNAGHLVLGPLLIWASTGRPQRHYLSMFRRSIEANEALLAQADQDPEVNRR